MPELRNRTKHEEELAAALLLVFEDYEDDGSDIDWPAFQADLEAALGPTLTAAYQDAFERLLSTMRADLGDVSIADRAKVWSDNYARELATLIVSNTRTAVVGAGALDTSGQFDEDRAAKIAITEVTRAVTAGEYAAITGMLALGLVTAEDAEPIWHTCEDDRVCKDCQPLHGQSRDVWIYSAPMGPPLHPRCRCWLDYAGEATEAWTDEARRKSAETRARNKKLKEEGKGVSKVVEPESKREYRKLDHATSRLELQKASEESLRALDRERVDAINTYTTGGYYQRINYLARHGAASATSEYGAKDVEEAERITKILASTLDSSKVPMDVVAYRGMRLDGDKQERYVKRYGSLGVGDVVIDKGFLSTSVNARVGLEFSEYDTEPGAVLEIRVPKGAKGLYISSLSEIPEEGELLLQRGTKLRLVEKKTATHLVFEVVA